MKQRVIICGYPKSGNTWLTRLVAEVIGCPVIGFWGHPLHLEDAREGMDRVSDYHCFKAHHNRSQLEETFEAYANGSEKIIYIYRDPRDVVVSASNYFNLLPKYIRFNQFMCSIPFGYKLYKQFFHTERYHLDTLTKGLVKGIEEYPIWLRTPWKQHLEGFLEDPDIHSLSFESLKADTLQRVVEVCDFLEISRTREEMEQAVHNQSFAVKKQTFLDEGDQKKADFMKSGKSGSWKKKLGPERVHYIESEIGTFMKKLGYDLST